jgi:hypothetical protein
MMDGLQVESKERRRLHKVSEKASLLFVEIGGDLVVNAFESAICGEVLKQVIQCIDILLYPECCGQFEQGDVCVGMGL